MEERLLAPFISAQPPASVCLCARTCRASWATPPVVVCPAGRLEAIPFSPAVQQPLYDSLYDSSLFCVPKAGFIKFIVLPTYEVRALGDPV